MSDSIGDNLPSAPALSEDCIVVRDILSGNVNAFAILEKKYRRQVTSLMRRMVRDPDDVQDLVQLSFIKAYRALGSFVCDFSFEKWLYKIASNNCIDYLRRKRFNIISIDKPIQTSEGEMPMELRDPHAVEPDEPMLASERAVLLNEAYESLSPKYKEVIRMRHHEELEYSEIAEKLNLPLGTVKAHIFRARQHMLRKLKKHSHLFQP